jgi:hypothetical protein
MMAICGFVARSGGEDGPVGPSSARDAATGLQIATPKGQGEKGPRTSLAARQVAPLPAFATASPGRFFTSVMSTC